MSLPTILCIIIDIRYLSFRLVHINNAVESKINNESEKGNNITFSTA